MVTHVKLICLSPGNSVSGHLWNQYLGFKVTNSNAIMFSGKTKKELNMHIWYQPKLILSIMLH